MAHGWQQWERTGEEGKCVATMAEDRRRRHTCGPKDNVKNWHMTAKEGTHVATKARIGRDGTCGNKGKEIAGIMAKDSKRWHACDNKGKDRKRWHTCGNKDDVKKWHV
eukprot:1157593-Pelagomonas_calceolata.AAC.3